MKKSQRKVGDGWGGKSIPPLSFILSKIVASVEVTDKPCQGICEEPAPGGAGAFSDRSSCLLQGPSATVVTAESWTPVDPQAPSETGGQARAEILTEIHERRPRDPRRKEKARWHHLGLIRWGREA